MTVEREQTMQATTGESDDGYPDLERLIRERVTGAKGPVFETNAEGLFQVYLGNLPTERRQHYTCHACRRFIERYGGLATIDGDGRAESFLWIESDAPPFFAGAMAQLRDKVARAKVTGVFLSSDKTWGQPETADAKRGATWSHLSAVNPAPFANPLKTAAQAMAEKREDYITLRRGLEEFSIEAARQAVRVLEADALDRSEKTLGVAKWLLSLHESLEGTGKGRTRDNLVWKAVATAPPGFCHVRSTMISTLLDDVVAGLDFDVIKRRWASKMHPLQYQRPTAPPKDGAIKQAEEIVAKLGSAGALARRFAKLEDILTFVWRPSTPLEPEQAAPGGVFGHLKQKPDGVKAVDLPAVTMTWDKFRRTVLPQAHTIQYLAPYGQVSFYGMVTAANADAPPILQWDGLAEGGRPLTRNPASWYYYHSGSPASRWGLTPGAWVAVNAICQPPFAWQEAEKFKHHGESIFLVLDGCRDVGYQNGAGFFPECLKADYHDIRSVLEAYVLRAVVSGKDEGTANGIGLQKGNANWKCTIRVNGSETYNLDRWD